MTNNSTEQLARRWAERIKSAPERTYIPGTIAAAEHILATTTPPTMADVEWDDEKHHLAGATTSSGRDVVMMWFNTYDMEISTEEEELKPHLLTPNGKRYELREIREPEHPKTLTTVEDYENAPEGTIVASNSHSPHVKHALGIWPDALEETYSEEELAGTPRKVLRWGWGE